MTYTVRPPTVDRYKNVLSPVEFRIHKKEAVSSDWNISRDWVFGHIIQYAKSQFPYL